MKRKLTAIFFCALMAIGVAMFAACDSGTEGLDIRKYDGIYYISSYNGTETDVVIPSKVDSIAVGAFGDCTITSVTFKNTEGWYVYKKSDKRDKIDVDVTDAANNATLLNVTYVRYNWSCE